MELNLIVDNKNLKQRISIKSKGKLWIQANVDAAIERVKFDYNDPNSNDRACDDLINGRLHKRDYAFLTNPYGDAGRKFPIDIENWPIVKGSYNLLKGEESKRKLPFRVIQVGENAIQERKEAEAKMIKQSLRIMLINELAKNGMIQPEVDPNTGEQKPLDVQHPEQIQRYMRYKYRGAKEIKAQRLAEYIEKEFNFDFEFNEAWGDLTTFNKSIFAIENNSGVLNIRRVNPRQFGCIKSPNSPFIEDGEAWVELQYMYPSEIYDKYHKLLKEEDRKKIDNLTTQSNFTSNIPAGRMVKVDFVNFEDNYESRIPLDSTPVYTVVWTSQKKIGYLTYIDENDGLEKQDLVDETFEITEPGLYDENDNLVSGQVVEWDWINQYWKCIRIGTKGEEGIYLDGNPIPIAGENINDIGQSLPPYIGGIWDEPSFVQECRPYQKLYNILMMKLRFVLSKAKDKIFLMDITQVPRQYGWDVEKWLYYADVLGVAVVNPFEEGKGQGKGKTSKFNQWQSIDLSMGNIVNQCVVLLDKIEAMLGEATGITRQRKGNISSTETVGGVERSVTQSSHITEPYFMKHYEIKRRVRQAALNIAKVCYKDKKIRIVQDDLGVYDLDLSDNFSDESYAIYASNNSVDWQNLQEMKGVLKQFAGATQNYSAIIRAIPSNSTAEIADMISESEEMLAQRQQASEQAQREKELMISKRQDEVQDKVLSAKKQSDDDKNATAIKLKQMEIEAEFYKTLYGTEEEADEAMKEFKKMELELLGTKINEDIAIKKEKMIREDRNKEKDRQLKRSLPSRSAK